jgi:hypothetical protein
MHGVLWLRPCARIGRPSPSPSPSRQLDAGGIAVIRDEPRGSRAPRRTKHSHVPPARFLRPPKTACCNVRNLTDMWDLRLLGPTCQ